MYIPQSTFGFVEYIKSFFSALRCIPHPAGYAEREPNVKTLRSPLSAEFWRHCVLNGGTQRRTNEELNIVNISFPSVRIEHTICRLYSHILEAPAPRLASLHLICILLHYFDSSQIENLVCK